MKLIRIKPFKKHFPDFKKKYGKFMPTIRQRVNINIIVQYADYIRII
jgi:hypothetical protein